MKHIKWNFFMIWDYDKEERWLNKMADQGLMLTDFAFCRYVFEEGEPGAYTYRLELLDNPSYARGSDAYLRFLKETGVEYVASWGRWVYLRRRREDGEFDLFSDLDSRIRHLRQIRGLNGAVLLCMLPAAMLNLNHAFEHSYVGGEPGRLVTGALCALLAVLCTYGVVHLTMKIRALEKERLTRE